MLFFATLALCLTADRVPDSPVLEARLRAHSPQLADRLAQAKSLRLQMLLSFGDQRLGYRVDAEYFYPASAIKLCAAIAALEKCAELERDTPGLSIDTPLLIEPCFADSKRWSEDASNLQGGLPTLRHEVRKLCLVSDNPAFNHLYEFVGQRELNERMWRAGLNSTKVLHRLSEARTPEENRRVPAVSFQREGKSLLNIPPRTDSPITGNSGLPGIEIGEAWLRGDERVEGPMSFVDKNRIALVDLQEMVRALAENRSFRLPETSRALLLESMTQYPADSANPRYARETYPDEWGKPFLPGLERVFPKDEWKIANKIGVAYGFTVDNAWIVNEKRKLSFFLSAVVYTNSDGVLNDNRYEYTTVAKPLFADLAEVAARLVLTNQPR